MRKAANIQARAQFSTLPSLSELAFNSLLRQWFRRLDPKMAEGATRWEIEQHFFADQTAEKLDPPPKNPKRMSVWRALP